MTWCWQTMMSLSFLQFMVSLEQSGTLIPDAWSLILNIFINNNLYFYEDWKTELKNLYHNSHTNAMSKVTFSKKDDCLQKNVDISKIKQVLKDIFSETTYLCVLTY